MQRALKNTSYRLAVPALSAVLLLAAAAHSERACAQAMTPAYVSNPTDSVPMRWRNYALTSITPRFSWAPQTPVAALPQVTDALTQGVSVGLALDSLAIEPSAWLTVSAASSIVDHRVPVLVSTAPMRDLELPSVGLQRYLIAPSYVQSWGERGVLGVTAILAHQRFATLGMGASTGDPTTLQSRLSGENSYGAGMRFDVGHGLGKRVQWNAGYQSRVSMDAFNGYRGMYSEPGKFDMPASASLGLSYALTSALSFDVGVERIMYSGVTPFTSATLPTRFLALLGSGVSPVFAWQDLNVYSAGWTLRDAALGNLELRYTTRQQPLPTSSLLQQALGVNSSANSVALGYSRATGRNSLFNLITSYSNSPYFLGAPSYRTHTDFSGDFFEVEARWALGF